MMFNLNKNIHFASREGNPLYYCDVGHGTNKFAWIYGEDGFKIKQTKKVSETHTSLFGDELYYSYFFGRIDPLHKEISISRMHDNRNVPQDLFFILKNDYPGYTIFTFEGTILPNEDYEELNIKSFNLSKIKLV